MNNEISVDELEKAFALIIDKLKTDNQSKIIFDIDMYWNVLGEDMSNFDIQPDLAVGALGHDLHFLRQSLEEDEMVSYVDFDRVAALLKAISSKLP